MQIARQGEANKVSFDLEMELAGNDTDQGTLAFDHLPGANFCRFAAFRLAIHLHRAFCHQCFPLSTTVGDAGKFEQIAQLDIFRGQLKCNVLHSNF